MEKVYCRLAIKLNTCSSGKSPSQCCGTGLGRIRIILPDPDMNQGHAVPGPDGYQFQEKDTVKLINYTVSVALKFQYAVRNTESYDNFDADEKDKSL